MFEKLYEICAFFGMWQWDLRKSRQQSKWKEIAKEVLVKRDKGEMTFLFITKIYKIVMTKLYRNYWACFLL